MNRLLNQDGVKSMKAQSSKREKDQEESKNSVDLSFLLESREQELFGSIEEMGYEVQLQDLFRITPDEHKEFIKRTTDPEGNVPTQQQCCICMSFAAEPLVCHECETAVMCSDCFEHWMKSQNATTCPKCRKDT